MFVYAAVSSPRIGRYHGTPTRFCGLEIDPYRNPPSPLTTCGQHSHIGGHSRVLSYLASDLSMLSTPVIGAECHHLGWRISHPSELVREALLSHGLHYVPVSLTSLLCRWVQVAQLPRPWNDQTHCRLCLTATPRQPCRFLIRAAAKDTLHEPTFW